jgi:acyl-CoA thioester hydrolase
MTAAILTTRVAPEWVDYNGHMNDAEYARVFSLGVDAFMEAIGLDEAGRGRHQITLFTLETHLCFLAEAHAGEALTVQMEVLDRDAKRLHVFFSLSNSTDQVIATSEQMLMAMGIDSERPTPLPEPVAQAVAGYGVVETQAWPKRAGQRIGIRRD